jgi:hypothetical protein
VNVSDIAGLIGAQVKNELIGLRVAEVLMPAAGPGASEVLNLLRPAFSKSQPQVSTQGPDMQQVQRNIPKISDSESFSASEDSKPASFPPIPEDTLLGFSCIISSHGEVRIRFELSKWSLGLIQVFAAYDKYITAS